VLAAAEGLNALQSLKMLQCSVPTRSKSKGRLDDPALDLVGGGAAYNDDDEDGVHGPRDAVV
jgi:hypothetical protein